MSAALDWNTCFSSKRYGYDRRIVGGRTEYQRDFDRLIFSAPFRKLQGKTQVFPLPTKGFVHNRLTHSLEVASVGRSLGQIVGERIADLPDLTAEAQEFFKYDLSAVVAAGCLAHDIGNPAFGHFGEKAISSFFDEHQHDLIGEKKMRKHFTDGQWADLTNFEGNANALRVLFHHYKGKENPSLRLTNATLVSILKYPSESLAVNKEKPFCKKYGFFQSEKELFLEVAKDAGLIRRSEHPISFQRHPFVFLVEAADDICYRIIDLEDAYHLGIVSYDHFRSFCLDIISELGGEKFGLERTTRALSFMTSADQQVPFLRARCITILTQCAADLFMQHADDILQGNYHQGLLDDLTSQNASLEKLGQFSFEYIYNDPKVVKIEIAGLNVMRTLLGYFVPAVLKEKRSALDKKVLRLIPSMHRPDQEESTAYHEVMTVLDYISSLTDSEAVSLFRELQGIEI